MTAAELVTLGRRVPLPAYLRQLWDRRHLVVALPVSALQAENRSSLLGGLWHLLNPLLLAGVYLLVFGVILGVDRGVERFPAFLVIGVFIFYYTSRSITAGARSIVANEAMMRSIRFPRAVLPVSAVLGEAISLGFSLVVMVLVTVVTGGRPLPSWLLLLPVLATQTMFNLGCAFIAARLTAHFRDTQQILPFALRLWLYLSGVFYATDRFISDETALFLVRLNPTHAFIGLARGALLDGGTSPHDWMVALGWSVALLIGGFAWFRAHEEAYGRG